MPPKATGKTAKTPVSKGGTAAKPAKAAAPKSTPKAAPAAKAAETAKLAEVQVEKPPEHKITVKEIATFVLQDADKIVKNSKWFPLVIDPTEIAGRFLQHRECTFINGFDHEFIHSPDRIRIAVLAALRHGKKLVIDIMGTDLYEPIYNVMEGIQPGLLKMILDKSIMEEDNIQKLMRPEDDDIYKDILQYGLKDDFGFVIVTKNEDTNGFTDKMMKVRVEQ